MLSGNSHRDNLSKGGLGRRDYKKLPREWEVYRIFLVYTDLRTYQTSGQNLSDRASATGVYISSVVRAAAALLCSFLVSSNGLSLQPVI